MQHQNERPGSSLYSGNKVDIFTDLACVLQHEAGTLDAPLSAFQMTQQSVGLGVAFARDILRRHPHGILPSREISKEALLKDIIRQKERRREGETYLRSFSDTPASSRVIHPPKTLE